VLHVFPHWNWPGKEGQEISVWAYSNCEEVELFLNGRSLGRKLMTKNSHLEWPVKYTPGTLLARGFKNGREILTAKVETTGQPASIQLTPVRWGERHREPGSTDTGTIAGTLRPPSEIQADGEAVSVITVHVTDAQGRKVSTADNLIAFELTGPGKIIGVGNGNPSSHEPDQFIATASAPSPVWQRSLFNGLAQVIVQSTKEPGDIKLTASARGLASTTLPLSARPATLRLAVP